MRAPPIDSSPRLRAGLLGALLLVACGGPATRLEPEAMTVESPSGETIRVDFTLLEEGGRAVDGEEVTFTLEGAPPEVTLRDATAITDSRGGVTAVVMLGAEGTFELIARAGDAIEGIVTITVGARAEPYLDCDSDMTCSSTERCLDVTTMGTAGRTCTRNCTTDDECPTRTERGAACMTAGTRPVCLARCVGPLDCVVGNSCVSYTSREGTNMVCLPN